MVLAQSVFELQHPANCFKLILFMEPHINIIHGPAFSRPFACNTANVSFWEP